MTATEAESRPGPPPPRVVGLTVVSTAAVIALLYYGEPLLVPLAFALFLSFALRPFVSLLERGRAGVVAILLILFVILGGVSLLIINVTAQIKQFFAELPRYQTRIRDLLTGIMNFVNSVRERMGSILPEEAPGVREVKITASQLETTRPSSAASARRSDPALRRDDPLPDVLHAQGPREVRARARRHAHAQRAARRERRHGSDLADDDGVRLGLSFVMLIMAGATTIALMLLRSTRLRPRAARRHRHPPPLRRRHPSTIPAVAVAFFKYDGERALLVFLVYSLMQFLEGNVLTPYIVAAGPPLFPDRHGRFHLLGDDLGLPAPASPCPDLGDQGRLRARPRLGRPGPPPGRAGPPHFKKKPPEKAAGRSSFSGSRRPGDFRPIAR